MSLTAWRFGQNRKDRQDPSQQLTRTHVFDSGDNNFAVGTFFPERDRLLTVKVVLLRTGTANGVVLDMGNATTGLAIWFDDGAIGFCAGDAAAADGVEFIDSTGLPGVNQRFSFVFSVNPGNGKILIWRDGRVIGRAQASGGTLPNGWGAAANGAVGDVGTDITTRVPLAARVALANASVIGKVSIYQGQGPLRII